MAKQRFPDGAFEPPEYMNNKDFREHFVNACKYLNIEDFENRTFKVSAVIEDDIKYTSADDVMRIVKLRETQVCSFDEVVSIFTWKNCYYPLWIKIIPTDDIIIIKSSLHMRCVAAGKTDKFYPFVK